MALIFIVIIAVYRANPREETGLSEMSQPDQEFYLVAYENSELEMDTGQSENDQESENPNISDFEDGLSEQQIDEKFGTIDVEYTEEGFKPRANIAALGQEFVLTNKTDRTINFYQRKKSYPDFPDIIKIEPEESFSLRMTVLGMWTYHEDTTRDFGYVDVREPDEVFVPEKTPENTEE